MLTVCFVFVSPLHSPPCSAPLIHFTCLGKGIPTEANSNMHLPDDPWPWADKVTSTDFYNHFCHHASLLFSLPEIVSKKKKKIVKKKLRTNLLLWCPPGSSWQKHQDNDSKAWEVNRNCKGCWRDRRPKGDRALKLAHQRKIHLSILRDFLLNINWGGKLALKCQKWAKKTPKHKKVSWWVYNLIYTRLGYVIYLNGQQFTLKNYWFDLLLDRHTFPRFKWLFFGNSLSLSWHSRKPFCVVLHVISV